MDLATSPTYALQPQLPLGLRRQKCVNHIDSPCLSLLGWLLQPKTGGAQAAVFLHRLRKFSMGKWEEATYVEPGASEAMISPKEWTLVVRDPHSPT